MAKIIPFDLSTPPSEELSRDRMAHGDLRLSKKAVCQSCGHMWWAPVIGKCPRCKAEGAKIIHEQELDYKRV